ncbi:MAG: hypothetical protein V4671_08385 [Armatimonadota bacterium]
MPEKAGGDFLTQILGGGAVVTLITLWVNSLRDKRKDAMELRRTDGETELKTAEFWSKEQRDAYLNLKTRLTEAEHDLERSELKAEQYKAAARFKRRQCDDLVDLIHRALTYARQGLPLPDGIVAEMERCELLAPNPELFDADHDPPPQQPSTPEPPSEPAP